MIHIGNIKTTHHLKGGLKLSSSFEDFDIILGEKVFLDKNGVSYVYTLKNYQKMNDKTYIIYFEEVDNIEKAKELAGFNVKVIRSLLPKANKEEYYMSDLITFEVINDGKILGNVVDIMETAAHDILVIQNDEKEILIPFVEDVFIEKIDFVENKIHVNLIEGLI